MVPSPLPPGSLRKEKFPFSVKGAHFRGVQDVPFSPLFFTPTFFFLSARGCRWPPFFFWRRTRAILEIDLYGQLFPSSLTAFYAIDVVHRVFSGEYADHLATKVLPFPLTSLPAFFPSRSRGAAVTTFPLSPMFHLGEVPAFLFLCRNASPPLSIFPPPFQRIAQPLLSSMIQGNLAPPFFVLLSRSWIFPRTFC